MTGPRSSRAAPARAATAAIAAALLLASSGAFADADDSAEPSVTPYRPTVSNPADLPAPGWLEGEFGGLRTNREDHTGSDSVPWLLKYAFDENHGLLLGGNAYLGSRTPGGPSHGGAGDTFVEWKQRFPVADKAAFGVEAGVVAPTAARDLGVGKPQWMANGIFSTDLGSTHLDLNLGAAHGGEQATHVSRWQMTWAAAVSAPLAHDWGAAFELSGMHQSGVATQSQALLALNYNVSNRLSLDAGLAHGLAHEAHDRSVFAGATLLIGKVR